MHQRGEPAEHPMLLTDLLTTDLEGYGRDWNPLPATRGQQVKSTFVDDVGRS
jgi:hypothetical protein